jgi:hypothetical protein
MRVKGSGAANDSQGLWRDTRFQAGWARNFSGHGQASPFQMYGNSTYVVNKETK